MIRRLAAGAVVVAALALWAPQSALAGTTHTISFGPNGPSPASLTIAGGDRVQFRNDVDPSASVPILGKAGGLLSSVTVTVSGLTDGSFALSRGQSVTVGPYQAAGAPFVLHYSATYSSKLVLDTLTGPSKQTAGTMTIAPAAAKPPRPTTAADPTTAPPTSGAAGSPPPTTTPSTQPESTTPPSSGPPASSVPTIYYTPHVPDVAGQVVPGGAGGGYRSGATTPSSSPAASTHTDNSTAAPSTLDEAPGTNSPMRNAALGSDTGSPSGVDWTEVIAVALLCGVVAVLVRTLVAHRRAG